MEEKYLNLINPFAYCEINKHKWLESEKAGRDIGFINAAVDWINKYGEQWRQSYGNNYKSNDIFIERREFRRFRWDNCVKIVANGSLIFAKVINLSFFGLLCRTSNCLQAGAKVRIHLSDGENDLMCIANAERVLFYSNSGAYEVFLRFDSNCRKKMIDVGLFRKISF